MSNKNPDRKLSIEDLEEFLQIWSRLYRDRKKRENEELDAETHALWMKLGLYLERGNSHVINDVTQLLYDVLEDEYYNYDPTLYPAYDENFVRYAAGVVEELLGDIKKVPEEDRSSVVGDNNGILRSILENPRVASYIDERNRIFDAANEDNEVSVDEDEIVEEEAMVVEDSSGDDDIYDITDRGGGNLTMHGNIKPPELTQQHHQAYKAYTAQLNRQFQKLVDQIRVDPHVRDTFLTNGAWNPDQVYQYLNNAMVRYAEGQRGRQAQVLKEAIAIMDGIDPNTVTQNPSERYTNRSRVLTRDAQQRIMTRMVLISQGQDRSGSAGNNRTAYVAGSKAGTAIEIRRMTNDMTDPAVIHMFKYNHQVPRWKNVASSSSAPPPPTAADAPDEEEEEEEVMVVPTPPTRHHPPRSDAGLLSGLSQDDFPMNPRAAVHPLEEGGRMRMMPTDIAVPPEASTLQPAAAPVPKPAEARGGRGRIDLLNPPDLSQLPSSSIDVGVDDDDDGRNDPMEMADEYEYEDEGGGNGDDDDGNELRRRRYVKGPMTTERRKLRYKITNNSRIRERLRAIRRAEEASRPNWTRMRQEIREAAQQPQPPQQPQQQPIPQVVVPIPNERNYVPADEQEAITNRIAVQSDVNRLYDPQPPPPQPQQPQPQPQQPTTRVILKNVRRPPQPPQPGHVPKVILRRPDPQPQPPPPQQPQPNPQPQPPPQPQQPQPQPPAQPQQPQPQPPAPRYEPIANRTRNRQRLRVRLNGIRRQIVPPQQPIRRVVLNGVRRRPPDQPQYNTEDENDRGGGGGPPQQPPAAIPVQRPPQQPPRPPPPSAVAPPRVDRSRYKRLRDQLRRMMQQLVDDDRDGGGGNKNKLKETVNQLNEELLDAEEEMNDEMEGVEQGHQQPVPPQPQQTVADAIQDMRAALDRQIDRADRAERQLAHWISNPEASSSSSLRTASGAPPPPPPSQPSSSIGVAFVPSSLPPPPPFIGEVIRGIGGGPAAPPVVVQPPPQQPPQQPQPQPPQQPQPQPPQPQPPTTGFRFRPVIIRAPDGGDDDDDGGDDDDDDEGGGGGGGYGGGYGGGGMRGDPPVIVGGGRILPRHRVREDDDFGKVNDRGFFSTGHGSVHRDRIDPGLARGRLGKRFQKVYVDAGIFRPANRIHRQCMSMLSFD